jgi:hypothetical protein
VIIKCDVYEIHKRNYQQHVGGFLIVFISTNKIGPKIMTHYPNSTREVTPNS